jgi:serine/threonine protein kinase/Flp pilus assembly protein TadD
VGDEVFGFRLRTELGRGAFARVFLAEQENLAGRPVVLKVSGIDGDEPYTLAQLQHTNVVPIFSVHEDGRAGLRALCMPYFGGASLSSAIRPLWEGSNRPEQGLQLVQALQKVQAPVPDSLKTGNRNSDRTPLGESTGQTQLDQLSGMSYVQAMAWIVARLAEGLQHAHQRGVLHRDIKPSNILLGADGQPMLLDFNLAQSLHDSSSKAEATLGGTVAYMAPEHLRALANPNPDTIRQVDQRSDIYSLGMVLFEMLTGHSPFDQSASYSILPVMIEAMAVERSQAAPSVRKQQPRVPWGLESIARKCLAPEPSERYQEGEDLAEDLRRFLEDRPLKFAPELSQVERARKWIRRHPRLTSSASVATFAALLLVAAVVSLIGVRKHLASTRQQLQAKQARERMQAYEAGTERVLCLLNTTAELHDNLGQGIHVAKETLDLYGILDRDDWQDDPMWLPLDEDDRQRLSEKTREMLLLYAWAMVRTSPGDRAALLKALAYLEKAESIRGLQPSKAVWTDRASYLTQLGNDEEARTARRLADELQPATARDFYLLATSCARKGDAASWERAIQLLDEAIRRNRHHHYWSCMQRGICHERLREFELAVGDFATCIGLQPELPWGYFNRGYVLGQCGKQAQAIDDYSATLDRDPGFLPAYVNRGMARLDLKQYEPALADFDRAMALGRNDAFLHAGRGMALEGLHKSHEADDAFRTAFAKFPGDEATAQARVRLGYAFAVSDRLPDRARAEFERVLEVTEHEPEPCHAEACYGLAMLVVQQDLDRAIEYLEKALKENGRFLEARRSLAILLARKVDPSGRLMQQACHHINMCLQLEPEGGATLYAAACVQALIAKRYGDGPASEQALQLLEKAFLRGYGKDKAAADEDLAGLRQNPHFQVLLAKKT